MKQTPVTTQRPHHQTLRRIGWLLLIWACSVAGLAVLAYGMKILMRFAGMST